ncbi:MAG: stage V sporulation protein AD [Oscillospiraceae bacterium]|jgi:stage V sporulation protein AD|nr:stage V sporulation protein AD [Oscillospiraceae bacterium]
MKSTIIFNNKPVIKGYASVAGKKEIEGNLSEYFDYTDTDQYFKKDTWEQAESEIQRIAVDTALNKSNLTPEDINFIFAGDLVNQCVSSTYGLRDFHIPFLGVYGACSTMAESLLLATCMVNAGYGKLAIGVTSSHFSSAERQFRMPLSYGGQRTPSAQWTVTGGGAVIVEENSGQGDIFIKSATVGKLVDYDIKDATNMGAAMAPAAADTIQTFLKDTEISLSNIDFIITGDLGYVGSELLIDILQKEGIDISSKHRDCGIMIYDKDTQDTHSGGSGCGCGASVLTAYFLPKLQKKEIKNILFCATGALMSPTLSQQGESIPSIAHLLHISSSEN